MLTACRFPKGAIVLVVVDEVESRRIVRDFTLEEETFGNTFQVMNDETLDVKRLANDPAYYSAALMATRVHFSEVAVTPEIILDLHPEDGRYLLARTADLEQRRELFRSQIETAQEGHPGPEKTGIHDGGSPGHEPGGSPGV